MTRNLFLKKNQKVSKVNLKKIKMFCKKCHKRIIKEVITVNVFKNNCTCSKNFSSYVLLDNTELNGYHNSVTGKRKSNKIKKDMEKIENK